MQEGPTLYDQFRSLKISARERIWNPPPVAPLSLRITSFDKPDDIPFEPLAILVGDLERITRLRFHLVGGGYGCFDMALSAEAALESDPSLSKSAGALAEALTGDVAVQRSLNELRAHAVSVETKRSIAHYRGFDDIEIAIATNRQRVSETESDLRCLFGADAAETLTYGLANVSISDVSKRQSRASLLKRAWHQIVERFASRREPMVVVRRWALYDNSAAFQEVLAPRIVSGAVVLVHGFANKFGQAFDTWALAIHRIRLHDLGFLPVIFSWPAHGNPLRYLDDTNDAEDSEAPLLRALEVVGTAASDKPLSVLAHSHGNKLLVRSLTTLAENRERKTDWLSKLVMIEPDMGKKFFEQRASVLVKSAAHIVMYHSTNDLPLALSSLLFDRLSAGRSGISPTELDHQVAARLEVVDATAVAAGVLHHAPHIDSAEVIEDLYYLFQGQPPQRRHGLRPISAARWGLTSGLTR